MKYYAKAFSMYFFSIPVRGPTIILSIDLQILLIIKIHFSVIFVSRKLGNLRFFFVVLIIFPFGI